MHSGILIIFCGTLAITNSFPTLLYDYYNQNTGNIEEIEFRDDDYQNPEPKRSPCLQFPNGQVKCFFTNGIQENLPETLEPSIPYDPTDITGTWEQGLYEQNVVNLETPIINELNPIYNTQEYESSPVHYSTYIHGLVPQDSAFYDTIYPNEVLPFNRLARRTTSYDEFLAQLEHDAMMNNILPTMSVRSSGRHILVPYNSGPAYVRASYPRAVGGCAQPLLFSCSPTIYQGVIAHKGYPYATQVQPLPSIHPYKEALRNNKVAHDKVKPSVDTNKDDYLEAPKVSAHAK